MAKNMGPRTPSPADPIVSITDRYLHTGVGIHSYRTSLLQARTRQGPGSLKKLTISVMRYRNRSRGT